MSSFPKDKWLVFSIIVDMSKFPLRVVIPFFVPKGLGCEWVSVTQSFTVLPKDELVRWKNKKHGDLLPKTLYCPFGAAYLCFFLKNPVLIVYKDWDYSLLFYYPLFCAVPYRLFGGVFALSRKTKKSR